MNGLRVIPTRRHGRDRRYACRPDGSDLGRYDRERGPAAARPGPAGAVTVLLPAVRYVC